MYGFSCSLSLFFLPDLQDGITMRIEIQIIWQVFAEHSAVAAA